MQKPSPTSSDRHGAAGNRFPARVAAVGAALCLLMLGGCASWMQGSSTAPAPAPDASTASGAQTFGPTGLRRALGFLAPYRINVQQGNFVSSEMLANLKVGMTPDQVKFALGTPLLVDVFHVNRWDYIFRLQRGNGEVTTSRVTVFFKDNRVASFEGGNLPTESEYLARIAGNVPAAKDAPKDAIAPPAAAPAPAPTAAPAEAPTAAPAATPAPAAAPAPAAK